MEINEERDRRRFLILTVSRVWTFFFLVYRPSVSLYHSVPVNPEKRRWRWSELETRSAAYQVSVQSDRLSVCVCVCVCVGVCVCLWGCVCVGVCPPGYPPPVLRQRLYQDLTLSLFCSLLSHTELSRVTRAADDCFHSGFMCWFIESTNSDCLVKIVRNMHLYDPTRSHSSVFLQNWVTCCQ